MDEASGSLLALTEPRPGVQGARPQSRSQPLQAIDEEEEDEVRMRSHIAQRSTATDPSHL